jgi:hypothetical protein
MTSTRAPNTAVIEKLESRSLLSASAASGTIIPNLPATPQVNATTVPANGDVNPYGVAVVPKGFPHGGATAAGDVLVSNFNNSGNVQGTGTTIVSVSPAGKTSLFFQGASGLGLTTALGVLKAGFVLVGNVPTTDGTAGTIGATSLLIINSNGHQVGTLSDPTLLNGPWDLTVHDQGSKAQIFVANVLSGTITRLDVTVSHSKGVTVKDKVQIASGYIHQPNQAAVVVGPTGLVFDAKRNVLFVDSTGDNKVYEIPNPLRAKTDAGAGTVVYQSSVYLHGPLALAQAPNGDLLSAQGDAINSDPNQASEIVEFTPAGKFVAELSLSSTQGGAFGLAISSTASTTTLDVVNDISNTLEIFTIKNARHAVTAGGGTGLY